MCIPNHELNVFPVLKDFSDDISGNINNCDFLVGIMKSINIWETPL